MDINTIIETFVNSAESGGINATARPRTATATIPATTSTTAATTKKPRAPSTVLEKRVSAMITRSKKDKQARPTYDYEDDDEDDEDDEDDDDGGLTRRAGDKRKSLMQQRQSQAPAQVRKSHRHSVRRYSRIGSVPLVTRKSTSAAAVVATAPPMVDVSALKMMKHPKAVRRQTRVDMLGIGANGHEDDRYHEIEDMYAAQKEMRRQSSRHSTKPWKHELDD